MGINLDLSKALHPRALDLLTAFMPGLFFEICISLGNPQLINSLIQPQADHLITFIIAIVLAFVIGNFCMLWVRTIQFAFSLFLRVWYWSFPRVWRKLLFSMLRVRGNPPRRPRIGRFRVVQRAYASAFYDNGFRVAFHAWRQVTTRILELYKIVPPDRLDPIEAWRPWTGVIGRLEAEDVRGYLLMVATHATGWSGIFAAYFAPRLQTRYFAAFCLFSIAMGLLHDFGVAHRLCRIDKSWVLGLNRAFQELKRLTIVSKEQPETGHEDEG